VGELWSRAIKITKIIINKTMKNKKLPTIKCPTCGKEITREDLAYSQTGEMIYKLTFTEDNEPLYEQDEFFAENSGEFFHEDCGGEALTSEELEKLGIRV
jgi:hypothetical protein